MRVNVMKLLFCLLLSFFFHVGFAQAENAIEAKQITQEISLDNYPLEDDPIGTVVESDYSKGEVKKREYSVSLLDGMAAKKVIDDFTAKLIMQKMPQKIMNCFRVIHVPVITAGHMEGNHSYGAVCNIEEENKKKLAVLCKDDFLGRLKIANDFYLKEKPAPKVGRGILHAKVPSGFTAEKPSTYQLINFVTKNCYGG